MASPAETARARTRAYPHQPTARARAGLLPDPDAAHASEYDDYLSNFEFGLAFEELVRVAEHEEAGSAFWRPMRDLARDAHFTANDMTHGGAVQLVEEHAAESE